MVVKKTVSLDPRLDRGVREAWAMLVDDGVNARYSYALSWLLLAGILVLESEDLSLSPEAAATLRDYLRDPLLVHIPTIKAALRRRKGVLY